MTKCLFVLSLLLISCTSFQSPEFKVGDCTMSNRYEFEAERFDSYRKIIKIGTRNYLIGYKFSKEGDLYKKEVSRSEFESEEVKVDCPEGLK